MSDEESDEAVFAGVCGALYPRLVGSLSLYCRDRELAHDVAQEAFARLWRDWPHLKSLDSVEAYAYRVAWNLARSNFRRLAVRRKYRHLLSDRSSEVHRDPEVAETMTVRDAVSGLADSKRAALVLRYYADLSVAATAEAMRVPPNTVKTLTRRALADLRHVLTDLPAQEERHAK